jgi:hypothetical protein
MKLDFASGGQGDSFRENRPPGPLKHLQKLLIKGFDTPLICKLLIEFKPDCRGISLLFFHPSGLFGHSSN